MRILHAVWAMHAGGAERQLIYLVRELLRHGVDVHVVVVRDGPLMPMLDSTGTKIHRMRPRWNYDPRTPLEMIRLVRTIRPQIVQTWLTQMDLVAGSTAALLGVPWILSERSATPAYPPTLRHRLRKWIGGRAASIVCNSSGGMKYWRDRVAVEKLALIPNAVPVDAIEQTAAANAADASDRPVVLFAGRLSEEKAPEAFLSAMEALQGEVAALVCGDGPERSRVVARISSSPILQRSVTHSPYEPNVWACMRSAAAFVAPSRFEGHPNAVLEAMAAGTPLIVSDIDAHREFLDEESAIFVPVDDPESIARAVRDVLARPEAALARAARARELVRPFSVETMTRSFIDLYDATIRGRGRAETPSGSRPGASSGSE